MCDRQTELTPGMCDKHTGLTPGMCDRSTLLVSKPMSSCTMAWYVHCSSRGVTGSSFLSRMSTKGEASCPLEPKSNRPRSSTVVKWCRDWASFSHASLLRWYLCKAMQHSQQRMKRTVATQNCPFMPLRHRIRAQHELDQSLRKRSIAQWIRRAAAGRSWHSNGQGFCHGNSSFMSAMQRTLSHLFLGNFWAEFLSVCFASNMYIA